MRPPWRRPLLKIYFLHSIYTTIVRIRVLHRHFGAVERKTEAKCDTEGTSYGCGNYTGRPIISGWSIATKVPRRINVNNGNNLIRGEDKLHSVLPEPTRWMCHLPYRSSALLQLWWNNTKRIRGNNAKQPEPFSLHVMWQFSLVRLQHKSLSLSPSLYFPSAHSVTHAKPVAP